MSLKRLAKNLESFPHMILPTRSPRIAQDRFLPHEPSLRTSDANRALNRLRIGDSQKEDLLPAGSHAVSEVSQEA